MTEEPKKFSLLGGLIAQQNQPKKGSSNGSMGDTSGDGKGASRPSLLAPAVRNPVGKERIEHAAQRSLLGSQTADPAPNQAAPARSLLGNVAQPDRTPVPAAAPKPSLLAHSLTQVAKVEAEKRIAREQESEMLFRELPMDFKELLDSFDAALVRDKGITDFNLDLSRSYVKRIMVDLKENPEFDGLMIDRDVHNIMRFIRAVHERAKLGVAEKKEKAVAKPKKLPASKRFNLGDKVLDLGALGDIDL